MSTEVRCTECGRLKAPRTSDVPMARAGSVCMPDECEGYIKPPMAPACWPDEPVPRPSTSEHMKQLAREHPGGFMVIPAMFERWAAEITTYRDILVTIRDKSESLEYQSALYKIHRLAQAALDAKDEQCNLSS